MTEGIDWKYAVKEQYTLKKDSFCWNTFASTTKQGKYSTSPSSISSAGVWKSYCTVSVMNRENIEKNTSVIVRIRQQPFLAASIAAVTFGTSLCHDMKLPFINI